MSTVWVLAFFVVVAGLVCGVIWLDRTGRTSLGKVLQRFDWRGRASGGHARDGQWPIKWAIPSCEDPVASRRHVPTAAGNPTPRSTRTVARSEPDSHQMPQLDIDYDRLKQRFQSKMPAEAAERDLPLIELPELQGNLQSAFRQRRDGRPRGQSASAGQDNALPAIDPDEVRASLRQIHGHRLTGASSASSVSRILSEPRVAAPKVQADKATRGGWPSPPVRPTVKSDPARERPVVAPAMPLAEPPKPVEAQTREVPLSGGGTEPAPAVRVSGSPMAVPAKESENAPSPAPLSTAQVAVVSGSNEATAPASNTQGMRQQPITVPAAQGGVQAVESQSPAPPPSTPPSSMPWVFIEEKQRIEPSPSPVAGQDLVWLQIDERVVDPVPTATNFGVPTTDSATQPHAQDPARQTIVESSPAHLAMLPVVYGDACMPPLDLLHPADDAVAECSQDLLLERGIVIEEKLAEFKVKVSVVDAYAGPVITRYEVEPAVGVRGNQVVNLMKDLSRALGLASIRVVETIPGKTCMGLELPNPTRQMIRLSEILSTEVFQQSSSLLTMALGKDIAGEPVVMDLAKAPHLLVAGTTGSGKSVGVNAMILSLLYKASPDQVRFLMIDPKMLELSVYNDIPHLLAPVVTDMKLAANALNWCVGEMERRYRLMSALGVRNLAGYNDKVLKAEQEGRRLSNPFSLTPDLPEPLAPLPFIVVVVDEFADLMMVAGKKIEELIARLAQKARAAGIHLILATQRPSVDVITGLIKANIPTRIAFQVSSKIDSRTILDQMGAESLLGQGDMLFLPPGTGYPQRVHGAFVTDNEVHQVVEHLKQFGEPDYVEGLLSGEAEAEEDAAQMQGSKTAAETDALYDEAVEIVLRTRKASISSVQRHLRIGYNRAARLIEEMEGAGIVSAMESNGNRTVLVPERNF
ncbi:DNA translocase FtsK [Crenobacter cavernae]|uniref:Cell division protein FtsK n=1 Tax=Crenobacter cavernae TaxID=2290923 RepID=A0A345Y8S1_9NEIS|nr:cell division protein FtsK [Crenobacter cavernae]